MLNGFYRRGRVNLAVDVLFFFLVAHLIITGNLVPRLLADLIHNPAPIAVVIEPSELIEEISPALDDVAPDDGVDPA